MLRSEEKSQIKSGQWEIDCPDMQLRSRAKDGGAFDGPGMMRLSDDGAISFKLYAAGDPRIEVRTFGTNPGVLIPDDHYFDLEARDFDGRIWRATRLLAERHENFSTSRLVWTGGIESLVHESDLGRQLGRASLCMEFLSDVEIPWNERIDSEKSVAGIWSARSSSVSAAKFQVSAYEFLLESQAGGFSLSVTCPGGTIPTQLELRVREALQFVLARWLSPRIVERFEGAQHTVDVRSAATQETSPRLQKPIALQSVDIQGRAWKLFGAYFSYLLAGPSQHAHRLSELLNSAIEGSRGSLYASALSLSVAVEGVLRLAFPALCAPAPEFCAEVDSAAKLIGQSGINIGKERILGTIAGLKSLRAQQGLERLLELGSVDKAQVAAWKKVRNKLAHAEVGDLSSPAAIQDFLDESLQLTVLLYRLIFTAVGYRGPYTDYGAPGWPEREHEPVTND